MLNQTNMTEIDIANEDYNRFVACLKTNRTTVEELAWTPMPVIAPMAPLVLAETFGRMEAEGRSPYQVRLNPVDFADLRGWEATCYKSPFISTAVPGNPQEPWLRGFLWDSYVITDPKVSRGDVLVMAQLQGVDLDKVLDTPDINILIRLIRITR